MTDPATIAKGLSEAPILVSDTRPFDHHLIMRTAKTRRLPVRRALQEQEQQ